MKTNMKCNHSDIEIKKINKEADEKFKKMERNIEILKKQIEENNAKIASLELRLEECENKFSNEKKSKDRKIKDLENSIKMKNEKLKNSFKCNFCDFETPSERGLNVHINRKHTNFNQTNIQWNVIFASLMQKVKVK